MVRALLAGTKTQTRRVLKQVQIRSAGMPEPEWRSVHALCPYGQPGDRLWVREAFSGSIAYERHGYPLKEWGNKVWYWADGNPDIGDWTRQRPSIHMPRHLSRVLLEVTGVRVERLQDISEADAMAEGTTRHPDGRWHAYRSLWTHINGSSSWDSNPWVWVVDFRRLLPGS